MPTRKRKLEDLKRAGESEGQRKIETFFKKAGTEQKKDTDCMITNESHSEVLNECSSIYFTI